MKSRKTILIMLVGLMLVAFATVMAQTPTQGDQKKKAEACCAMESCCGNDGSCSMKKEGETPSGDAAEAKDGCCGESCDMAKHDAKMKHDSKDHKDCCNMKQKDKDKTKTKKAA